MPAPTQYRDFAANVVLPLCRDRFFDAAHGGFHERLDLARDPLPVGHKRLLVQCRQLYVLSHAAVLGDASGHAAAEAGYAFLRRHYHDRRQGGWFFKVSPEGKPLDTSKDLYGHAFVLFALAWLHRAFGAPDAIMLARDTMDVLQRRLAAPSGGFWEQASEDWQPETGYRRQNPHMHLLEATLALFEATGEASWLEAAAALVALFRERFYDAATATLGEHFARDWSPDPHRGNAVEPGHHFEWVWLLHAWRRLSGRAEADEPAEQLFQTALRHGFDPATGGIPDEIARDGSVLQGTRRIWPVTEAIKAHAARVEAGHAEDAAGADRLIGHLFRDFLRPAESRWIERLARDGAPLQTDLPGSTPYHLFQAAAEAARVLAGR